MNGLLLPVLRLHRTARASPAEPDSGAIDMSDFKTISCFYRHPIQADGRCKHRHRAYDHDADPYKNMSRKQRKYCLSLEEKGYVYDAAQSMMVRDGHRIPIGKRAMTANDPRFQAPDSRFQGLANARANDKKSRHIQPTHVSINPDFDAANDSIMGGMLDTWKDDGFRMGNKGDSWEQSYVPHSNEPSLVWSDPTSGAKVYVCGQDDVTPENIKKLGLQVAISVTNPPKRWEKAVEATGIEGLIVPLADAGVYAQNKDHAENAKAALMRLGTAIKKGQNVSVNCMMGMHRSTATVYSTLYLLGYFPTLKEAFEQVHKGRKQAEWRDGIPQWMVGLIKPNDPQANTQEKPTKTEGGWTKVTSTTTSRGDRRADNAPLCDDCPECKDRKKVFPIMDGKGCEACGHLEKHTHKSYVKPPTSPITEVNITREVLVPASAVEPATKAPSPLVHVKAEATTKGPATPVATPGSSGRLGDGWMPAFPMLDKLLSMGLLERTEVPVSANGTVSKTYRYRPTTKLSAALEALEHPDGLGEDDYDPAVM